ncbi:MAG: hypothetical protein ABJG75_07130 [Roseobacter sp.]
MYKRLMVSGLTAFVFFFTPVQAQTAFIQDKVAQVEAEGYKVSSIKRSWLGRIVITAKKLRIARNRFEPNLRRCVARSKISP